MSIPSDDFKLVHNTVLAEAPDIKGGTSDWGGELEHTRYQMAETSGVGAAHVFNYDGGANGLLLTDTDAGVPKVLLRDGKVICPQTGESPDKQVIQWFQGAKARLSL